jgi:two-component system, NarL family, sensor histidine kinase UhpB
VKMSQKLLRVLFVEASQKDLQHTLTKLADNEYLVEYQRVEDADAMKAALLGNRWDIVLCSYNPPAFGGLEALNLMQAINVDLPFLFLSHNLREENIISAIQAGAGDYIFKGNLNRLIPAIEHFLRETTIRREHRQMLIDLKENQTRLHALISNLPGMAYQLVLAPSGQFSFTYVSDGCYNLLGLMPEDMERDPQLFVSMIHPADVNSYVTAMRNSAKWVNLRCTPRKMPQGIQWEGMMFNITERKLAEIEIMRSQDQLRELSAHIQDVREEERLSLAREVHDDMGSMLTAIKMDIAWLGSRLNSTEPALGAKIHDIEKLVNKCASAASNISRNLRPSALDCFGIVAAIEIEAHEFKQRTGINCILDATEDGISVAPNIAITLFRIFQEALNNIMKHAQASEVKISLHNRNHNIELSVSDNGRGLSKADHLKPRSFGLRGIQERVARYDGIVNINGKQGQGTAITVTIPHSAVEVKIGQTPQQTLF